MHHKKRHGQNSRPRISPFLSIYEEKNWGIVYDPWCFPNHRSPASAWPVFYSGTLQPTAWNDIICQDLKWNYKRWDHLFGKNAGLAFSRISQLSCAASWQSVFSEDNPLKKVSITNNEKILLWCWRCRGLNCASVKNFKLTNLLCGKPLVPWRQAPS